MVLSNLALFKCLTQTQACVLTCWTLSKPLYIHDIELFKVLDFIDFFFQEIHRMMEIGLVAFIVTCFNRAVGFWDPPHVLPGTNISRSFYPAVSIRSYKEG